MNPFAFAYSPPTVNGELEGVLEFSKPGRVVVTGRGNRMHPTFQKGRKLGLELWAYWNIFNVPDNLSNAQDAWQYLLADGARPPLWPFKDKNGQPRTQWPGTKMLDIRPGSAWLKHIVPKTAELIERHMHDGLMLDTAGARTWSRTKTVNGVIIPGADWETWTVDEQSLWAASAVNLVREIAEECARHSPMMKLVHNNLWQLPAGHPAVAVALNGEKYCNGCMFENPSGEDPSEFHKAWAGHAFGLWPRRVPVVDRTDAEAIEWSKVPGVTHVCSVESAAGESYAHITPPVVDTDGVPSEESAAENAVLRERVAELTAENATLRAELVTQKTRGDDLTAEVLELEQLLADIHAKSAPTT
jgi:hypothetical protein